MTQCTREFNAPQFGTADPVAFVAREAEVLERRGFGAFEALILRYTPIHRSRTLPQ